MLNPRAHTSYRRNRSPKLYDKRCLKNLQILQEHLSESFLTYCRSAACRFIKRRRHYSTIVVFLGIPRNIQEHPLIEHFLTTVSALIFSTDCYVTLDKLNSKTSLDGTNERFSDVFKRCKKQKLFWNGLIFTEAFVVVVGVSALVDFIDVLKTVSNWLKNLQDDISFILILPGILIYNYMT